MLTICQSVEIYHLSFYVSSATASFVTFGDERQATHTTAPIQRNICGRFTNPDVLYPIAIIKFCNPIAFYSHVAPVCLNTRADKEETDYAADQCKILGWGRESTSGMFYVYVILH